MSLIIGIIIGALITSLAWYQRVEEFIDQGYTKAVDDILDEGCFYDQCGNQIRLNLIINNSREHGDPGRYKSGDILAPLGRGRQTDYKGKKEENSK